MAKTEAAKMRGRSRAGSPRSSGRWSSAFGDPQWITIDLAEPADITRVRLN